MTDRTQPDPADIRHFVDRIVDLDRRDAINHYVRTGGDRKGTPDPVVQRVIDWLDTLAPRAEGSALGEQSPKQEG